MPSPIEPLTTEAPQRLALVTGAGGFTGRYVTERLLDSGYNVAGLTHSSNVTDVSPDEKSRRFRLYSCDLLDLARLSAVLAQIRPSHVVHLAGIAFVAHGDVDAVYRTNIIGTRNLLQALADNGIEPVSVILASSANIYGNADVDPIDESISPNPVNDYAVSKLAMELMAKLWFDRLPITITRPFNYTGPGQSLDFVLPKIVAHFARRRHEITLGNLDVERDFSDVQSIAETYCRLLDKAPAGEVFNLCSGRVVSLRDVLDVMAEIAGYRIKVHTDPMLQRRHEVRRLRGSDAKLRACIGERQVAELADTLRTMYQIMHAALPREDEE